MKTTVRIEGMMCGHCEARVKKALEAIDGIESAIPDHNANTAVITLSKDVPDAAHAKEHHDAIVGSGLAGWDDAGSSESGSSGDWDWGW